MKQERDVIERDKQPAKGAKSGPANGIYLKTLSTGIDILFLLSRGSCDAREIENELGLDRSATFRFLATLQARGLVDRNAGTGRYGLTTRLWEMGLAATNPGELRVRASVAVRALAERIGETVHLSVYDHGEVVYVDKADGARPISSYTRLGGRAPAYCVATGKVLLADRGEEELESLIERGLVKHTPKTVVDPEQLRQDMIKVVKTGYATNVGGWREDVGGIAIPLRDELGRAAMSLGLSGPVERIFQHEETLLAALLETRETIESPDGRAPDWRSRARGTAGE